MLEILAAVLWSLIYRSPPELGPEEIVDKALSYEAVARSRLGELSLIGRAVFHSLGSGRHKRWRSDPSE